MTTLSLASIKDIIDIESLMGNLHIDNNKCIICNILMTEQDEITIKCGHKYHYDCIYNWYKHCLNIMPQHSILFKLRECPYCRKDGGYLPFNEKYEYDKFIHKKLLNKTIHKPTSKKYVYCSAKTLHNKQCKNKIIDEIKYCHIHMKKNEK